MEVNVLQMMLNGTTTMLGWILILVFSLGEVTLNQIAVAKVFNKQTVLQAFTVYTSFVGIPMSVQNSRRHSTK